MPCFAAESDGLPRPRINRKFKLKLAPSGARAERIPTGGKQYRYHSDLPRLKHDPAFPDRDRRLLGQIKDRGLATTRPVAGAVCGGRPSSGWHGGHPFGNYEFHRRPLVARVINFGRFQ